MHQANFVCKRALFFQKKKFPTNRTSRKVFNFNVIDTVVIKYLVVCKCACDIKMFKFGADKIC